MKKAVIVFDMPEKCTECPFCIEGGKRHLGNYTYQLLYRCRLEPDDLEEDDDIYLTEIMAESRPKWCPLPSLPKKRRTRGSESENDLLCMNAGWNSCVDEILKCTSVLRTDD